MADPTLSMTFGDLVIRVAEYLGIADYSGGAAAAPSDAHDLDLCKRYVNDGYRSFINSYQRWQFLTPLFTISLSPNYNGTATAVGSTTTLKDTARTEATGFFNGYTIWFTGGTGAGQTALVSGYSSVTQTFTFGAVAIAPDTTTTYEVAPSQCVAGDSRRYYMPDGFYGSFINPFTPPPNGGYPNVNLVNEELIREMYAGASAAGYPTYAGVRPLQALATSSGKRWEVVFWPTPSTSYVLTARCRVYPDKMVNLTDKHICGPQFDEAIMASALAESERSRNDASSYHADNASKRIASAILLDKEAAPKRQGGYGDRSDDVRLPMRPYGYKGVDTYNGVPT
jgi:hypothetical protein